MPPIRPSVEERLRERDEYIPKSVRTGTPIFVDRAKGHKIVDADGEEYIDFTGGIGVLNTGHLPDAVTQAVRSQLDKYLHLCFMVLNYEPYIELAKRLRPTLPFERGKTAFFNSGAEAVENAVKMSRAVTRRPNVISFQNSFHGRTLLTLSMTGKYEPYKVNFEPFVPQVYQVPFAYCYRCPLKLSYPECGVACLQFIEDEFRAESPADKTACIVAEPVQGEGGFVVPPMEYWKGLRKITKDNGILFVDDEVQAGMGRTGKWWATEHFGVVPDLITSAKALGGGLPLSAVSGPAEIMDIPAPGSIGGTFGGNALACAAAIANLDLIRGALPNAEVLGHTIEKRFREMAEGHALIGDIRGLGAMQAIELVKDRKTKEPAKKETGEVIKEARSRGIIILSAGWYGNVVRLLPPLNMPRDALEEGLDVLDASLAAVEKTVS
ncbi:MAG TPA: aspartate aminotransferase family protein [Thermoplasmata archaeon]|jgi:4-aminobutyrate aminotransferase/(S)-3-amino-2-methylpropionate transaminase